MMLGYQVQHTPQETLFLIMVNPGNVIGGQIPNLEQVQLGLKILHKMIMDGELKQLMVQQVQLLPITDKHIQINGGHKGINQT